MFNKNDHNFRELAANFIFLPLCNPLDNEKYNPETQLCEEIDDCDKTALNALHCMEEATPLVCKKNYYINIVNLLTHFLQLNKSPKYLHNVRQKVLLHK